MESYYDKAQWSDILTFHQNRYVDSICKSFELNYLFCEVALCNSASSIVGLPLKQNVENVYVYRSSLQASTFIWWLAVYFRFFLHNSW